MNFLIGFANIRITSIFATGVLKQVFSNIRNTILRSRTSIPPNVMTKWTGHYDYKAMKPYIDIVDSIKASEMTKLNGLI